MIPLVALTHHCLVLEEEKYYSGDRQADLQFNFQ